MRTEKAEKKRNRSQLTWIELFKLNYFSFCRSILFLRISHAPKWHEERVDSSQTSSWNGDQMSNGDCRMRERERKLLLHRWSRNESNRIETIAFSCLRSKGKTVIGLVRWLHFERTFFVFSFPCVVQHTQHRSYFIDSKAVSNEQERRKCSRAFKRCTKRTE